MPFLIAVSLLWAFSFGLIKGRLAGLDSAFISAVRLGFALLVFLPFLRWRGLTLRVAGQLLGIGAAQFGLMYLAYNESFRHLHAHEVALFTLTTPVWVTLVADAWQRTFHLRALLAAAVALLGAVVVMLPSATLAPTALGFILVQVSNLAFAFGQVAYRHLRQQHGELKDAAIFALPCAGGFALALLALATQSGAAVPDVSSAQWLTLAYLGTLASGLGFFLWNVGVTRVTAGTAAVMNNAKIPLGIACSLLFFGESANLPRLLLSFACLGFAVWLVRPRNQPG